MSVPLQVRGLHKRLGGRPVLRGIELELAAGEFAGLIGPNGSGKSTLLRCFAGLLSPDAGSIQIDGHALNVNEPAAKRRLGYAVEPSSLPAELSGRQCLQLVSRARALLEVPREALRLAESLRLSRWLDEPVARYSFGTRQKLSIVLALLGRPPLLLFDESLNGLDPVSALAFKEHLQQLVRERGCAVLLATHGLEVAEYFLDRALLLIEGEIVQDWRREDLQQLRHTPGGWLERAVVEVLKARD